MVPGLERRSGYAARFVMIIPSTMTRGKPMLEALGAVAAGMNMPARTHAGILL